MKLIHIFIRLLAPALPQHLVSDSFGKKPDSVKTYVPFAFEGNEITLESCFRKQAFGHGSGRRGPQCSFVREESSWFCWTLLTAGTEKPCQPELLHFGITGSQGLYFKEHKGKKWLRCSVTLDPTSSFSFMVRAKRKGCVSMALLHSAAGLRTAGGRGPCEHTTQAHTHTRTQALVRRKAHWVLCSQSHSPQSVGLIPWIGTQKHTSRESVLITEASVWEKKYKVPFSSPWNAKDSSLNSHAWIKMLSKGFKWLKRQQRMKCRL